MSDFTLKDFLIMEGAEGSGRPTDGKRPAKSLWFSDHKLWYADMCNKHGKESFQLVDANGNVKDFDDPEDFELVDMYAVNPDTDLCYGSWKNNFNKGITYDKPRPQGAIRKQ